MGANSVNWGGNVLDQAVNIWTLGLVDKRKSVEVAVNEHGARFTEFDSNYSRHTENLAGSVLAGVGQATVASRLVDFANRSSATRSFAARIARNPGMRFGITVVPAAILPSLSAFGPLRSRLVAYDIPVVSDVAQRMAPNIKLLPYKPPAGETPATPGDPQAPVEPTPSVPTPPASDSPLIPEPPTAGPAVPGNDPAAPRPVPNG